MLNLDSVLREPLPATMKAVARRAVNRPLTDVGALGLSIWGDELPMPFAVLHESALKHNARWMQAFTERAGVSLCPHGKTTMSPQLFGRQLACGCWGITAATAGHVRTYRRFGVPRVLLANQLVARADIDLVLDEMEADAAFDFYALVDSLDGLAILAQALAGRPSDRPLQVLLEVGAANGRTGVRTLEEGMALGRALLNSPVRLRGIEAFEGIVGGSHVELAVHGMLDLVVDLCKAGRAEGWFAPGEVILSAGGSAFFDIAARVLGQADLDAPWRAVLRSGCYLTHDSLYYDRMQARMRQRAGALWGTGEGLRNALEVWAVVQSVPEPKRAICGLGKRDISFDMALPQPLRWWRPGSPASTQLSPANLRVTALNDQHAYIDAVEGAMPWRVGDRVSFGVGHPCTTFDKWPLVYVIDDDGRVSEGIRTFF